MLVPISLPNSQLFQKDFQSQAVSAQEFLDRSRTECTRVSEHTDRVVLKSTFLHRESAQESNLSRESAQELNLNKSFGAVHKSVWTDRQRAGSAMDCGGARCAPPPPSARTMVNSKVMVVAALVLFGVVLFIVCLHIYAKWFWRTHSAGAAVARSPTDVAALRHATRSTQAVGLARAVVEALPTFEYSYSEKAPFECAVCLEDFEDGERGRTLPKCGHAFHLDCIDMWLHSHSTCPLCRVNVGGEEEKEKEEAAVVVEIPDEQPVVGDVAAPFMAAMRQHRRSRAQLTSPNHSLPRTGEERATEEPAVVLKEFEAPLQVTIDAGGSGSSSNAASALSPMARASASFRRLLSRGKTPQDEVDEVGPSSSPRAPSPRPPPNV